MAETVDIRDVEFIRSGRWADSTGTERAITEGDIARMLDNSSRLGFRPPIKLGHEYQRGFADAIKEQVGIKVPADGLPALGYAIPEKTIKHPDGTVSLIGTLKDVPKKAAELIRTAYKNRSAEILKAIPDGKGGEIGPVFGGLALLGMTRPAIKQLAAAYSEQDFQQYFYVEPPENIEIFRFALKDGTAPDGTGPHGRGAGPGGGRADGSGMQATKRAEKRASQPPWSEANPVGKIPPDQIPDHVFAWVPESGPKSARRYPYKWRTPSGTWEIHIAGLQAALQRASQFGLSKYPGARAKLEAAARSVGFSENEWMEILLARFEEEPDEPAEMEVTMSVIKFKDKEGRTLEFPTLEAFAEWQKEQAKAELEPELQKYREAAEAAERKAREAEIEKRFAEFREPKDGKIIPKAVVDGIIKVAKALPTGDAGIKFSEGDSEKTAIDILIETLKAFRDTGLVDMSEQTETPDATTTKTIKELKADYESLKKAGLIDPGMKFEAFAEAQGVEV